MGIGIGLYIEPQALMGPYSTEPAHIRIQPDGSVDVYLGSGSHGQGLETTTAQLVSEHLGAAFDDITVHQGDTSETPYSFGTGGSRSGPILGASIREAALEVRAKVTRLLPTCWRLPRKTSRSSTGSPACAAPPASRKALAEIARVAYRQLASLPPDMEPGLDVVRRYRAQMPFVFSNACHVCTVEHRRTNRAGLTWSDTSSARIAGS